MREPIYMPWYERRRRRRRLRMLAGVVTVAIVGGMVGYRALTGTGQGQAAHAAPPPPSAVGEVTRTVHVSMADGELNPRRLILERGEPVRLVVHNIGHWFHDLYLEELGIHLHLWPGDEVTLRLLPRKRGTFKGGCLVEEHGEKEPFTVVVR